VGTSPTLSKDELAAALTGRLQPVPVPLGYRAGLLAVALALVVLPLLYLALTATVGFALYLHATRSPAILFGDWSQLSLWRLLAYLGPIVIGLVLLLFMVKPLFARPARRAAPVVLDPSRSPTLFAFVELLQRAVGAPMPRTIHVDCAVNASAGPRQGFYSLLRGDLLLTIGLPLVAGLSAGQLAAVLAHELGHFAQGSGMRLSHLVRSVNAWFARVVYERDELDLWLTKASTESGGWASVVLMLARLFVWLTRGVLWALMLAGHAVSTFMLRQMELDADRYEARLAGSDTFRETALRLRVLAAAGQSAVAALSESWHEKRLVVDFPTLVAAIADDFAEAEIDEAHTLPPASAFDTHPPDAERIARAEREAAPGVLRLDVPARALFEDYEGLAREATRAYYEGEQGIHLEGVQLAPVARFVGELSRRREAAKLAEDYLHGVGSLLEPLPLPEQAPGEPESRTQALGAARDAAEAATRLAARLEEDARQRCGHPGSPSPRPDTAVLREAVATRLSNGLSLAAAGGVAKPEGGGPAADEVRRLYAVLSLLASTGERASALAQEIASVVQGFAAARIDPDANQPEGLAHSLRMIDVHTARLSE